MYNGIYPNMLPSTLDLLSLQMWVIWLCIMLYPPNMLPSTLDLLSLQMWIPWELCKPIFILFFHTKKKKGKQRSPNERNKYKHIRLTNTFWQSQMYFSFRRVAIFFSHTFILFWMRKTFVIVKMYQLSFRMFIFILNLEILLFSVSVSSSYFVLSILQYLPLSCGPKFFLMKHVIFVMEVC